MIEAMMPEIENFTASDVPSVEAFVEGVEERLGKLSDERAVLKKFFPVRILQV